MRKKNTSGPGVICLRMVCRGKQINFLPAIFHVEYTQRCRASGAELTAQHSQAEIIVTATDRAPGP